jgi:hypothetical protein
MEKMIDKTISVFSRIGQKKNDAIKNGAIGLVAIAIGLLVCIGCAVWYFIVGETGRAKRV